ncbi:protein CDV3 homolog isoform X1 [Haliotis rufescens]|uniref:protein CDV3 homolog isoform X1 n=1 Tax=Haliotis rufescens TaxID=6454 RepID=UPI001EB01F16|nr:protein CDV3 homolog isoform X1 [Haliotis rufescens]
MAEASLDDFFAKKDKSKKKSKAKIIPAVGDVLEKTDESKPKKERKKRDKEKSQTSSNTSQGSTRKVEDDEEWIDFQDETEKDYSGLRIQNLQITKEEEDEREEAEEMEEGEDGEPKDRQGAASGPWAVSSSGQPQVAPGTAPMLGGGAQPEPAPQPPKPKEEAPVKTTGKYVPPGARSSGGGGSSSASSAQAIRRKKEAPNIKSEVDFPTLGGGRNDGFQDAQEANYEHPGSKRGMQLSLENKFAALQD